MPSTSPGRRARVVAETASSSWGKRARSRLISVPLPAPDWPVMTKTGSWLPVEEVNQFCALAIGEAPDGLRLADPAGVQEARGLDATELRHGHQDVDHLGRGHVLGRAAEDRLDVDPAVLQILLQLRPPDPDVVRTPQCVHALIQRTDGGVCWRLCGRHRSARS